ncbi:DMT family transporter [Aerophototrophica crusticola]|uniref:DMT family transporter n=1 Tax=Aerophototrophica crusticola TaxID=1709002 RepID=A0A858R3Y8_9PROT|nr:DMT family transporter [Rhodospirillaceae bacterium B3]
MAGGPASLAAARPAALAGVGWFVLAIFCFGVMDAMIKVASADYGTWQIMFFRAAASILPVAVLVHWSGGVSSLRTKRLGSHVLRALVGLAAVYGFFTSFRLMPLADAYAIGFAAPLFMTALSVPVLGEKVGWRRWAAVLVGFAGVMVMLRPGQGVLSLTALVPLAAAFFYSLTMLYVRVLARTETNAAIVFYFLVTLAAVSGVVMLPDWNTPDLAGFALLVAIGLVGGVAQIAFTQAFRLTAPSLLAPFEYTAMLWAVGFGYLLFGDIPDQAIWLGSAIVIASGLYIIHRESRVARGEG